MRSKKGQIQGAVWQLIILAVGIIVIGVIVGFSADFMTDTQSDYAAKNLGVNCGQNSSGGTGAGLNYEACGYAYNATERNLNAMTDVGEGQGTVTTVGILAVVIGLLIGVVALFGFMRGREQ